MIVSISSVASSVVSVIWHYVWSKGGATAVIAYLMHRFSVTAQVNSAIAKVKATVSQVIADAKGDVSKIEAEIKKL